MLARTNQDWVACSLPELQALQLSAQQTLAGIAPYLERLHSGRNDLHAFQLDGLLFYAVELIEGVLVDPARPVEFEGQNNQQFTEVQLARWWSRPFVERSTWEGAYGLEARHRVGQAALAQIFPELAARDVEKHIAAVRVLWFSDWPTGVRYEVLCFNGASPDCVTSWGALSSMSEARDCALYGGRGWKEHEPSSKLRGFARAFS
jgi:hypothetical protein